MQALHHKSRHVFQLLLLALNYRLHCIGYWRNAEKDLAIEKVYIDGICGTFFLKFQIVSDILIFPLAAEKEIFYLFINLYIIYPEKDDWCTIVP